jgi:hypothetical protein
MADYAAFLREALAPLLARKLAVPVLLLVVLLTATNIVIVRTMPPPGATALPPLFLVAAIMRVGGLLVLTVALMRLLADSPRSPWRPDAAFGLILLVTLVQFALSALIELAMGGLPDVLAMALAGVLFSLVVAPVAPWLMALAAEKPLALSPRPWLRDFGSWLPHVVLWSIVLLAPTGFVHTAIDRAIVADPDTSLFWPAMLFDGPLSALVLLLALGLNTAAYRRVARH